MESRRALSMGEVASFSGLPWPLKIPFSTQLLPWCFASSGPWGLGSEWISHRHRHCLEKQVIGLLKSAVTSMIPGRSAVYSYFQLKNALPPSHLSCAFINFDKDLWTTQNTRVGTRSANHKAVPAPSTSGIRQMPLTSHLGGSMQQECQKSWKGGGRGSLSQIHLVTREHLGELCVFGVLISAQKEGSH